MPSESVSTLSVASNGKASFSSNTVSLSSSVSALLPVPSESVSTLSVASSGNASMESGIPSPSVSGITPILIKYWSKLEIPSTSRSTLGAILAAMAALPSQVVTPFWKLPFVTNSVPSAVLTLTSSIQTCPPWSPPISNMMRLWSSPNPVVVWVSVNACHSVVRETNSVTFVQGSW